VKNWGTATIGSEILFRVTDLVENHVKNDEDGFANPVARDGFGEKLANCDDRFENPVPGEEFGGEVADCEDRLDDPVSVE
jgi:hypothetical protein